MGLFVNPDNSAFQMTLNSPIYVDKTKLIEYTNSVLNTDNAFICSSRPRRFGKSITANVNVIPSTVAAEAVLAVWRGKPHLAKYRRNEFFDKYYQEIFDDLNASQMIIAVLIFRYCDNFRKRESENADVKAQRPYSQYFLAYMIGRRLLKKMNISLEALNHNNFEKVKACFKIDKECFYVEEEQKLIEILKKYFNQENLKDIDGSTMAAAFRRFDILFRYLN